jgi:hypothetical protein
VPALNGRWRRAEGFEVETVGEHDGQRPAELFAGASREPQPSPCDLQFDFGAQLLAQGFEV